MATAHNDYRLQTDHRADASECVYTIEEFLISPTCCTAYERLEAGVARWLNVGFCNSLYFHPDWGRRATRASKRVG